MAKAAKAKQQAAQQEIMIAGAGGEVLHLRTDGRFELTPYGLRMAEATAPTKKAMPQPPQREFGRRFHDAMSEEIIKLSALAQKTLQANPYRADGDGEEEAKLRELAHADRQLLPLHDALIKADEPNSESAEYREGFRFRLMEAMATIAEVCEYDPLHHRLRQRRVGGKNRRTDAEAYKLALAGLPFEADQNAPEVLIPVKQFAAELGVCVRTVGRRIAESQASAAA
jgi:hypothetical protein